MSKKKVAKKATPVPKPSTLLTRALALFGPKGEFWIQSSEKEDYEAGFVDLNQFTKKERKNLTEVLRDADRLDESDVANIMQEEIDALITVNLGPKAIAAKSVDPKDDLCGGDGPRHHHHLQRQQRHRVADGSRCLQKGHQASQGSGSLMTSHEGR
jgi:hypothetical protein